jgi:hypothetical protein
MKKLWLFLLLVVGIQAHGQVVPEVISPVRVGNMELQNGNVFWEQTFRSSTSLKTMADQLKSREQIFSVLSINSVNQFEIKGTITNWQLSIEKYGEKRKKLPSFLVLPLNATFKVSLVNGQHIVRVHSIWFRNLSGDSRPEHMSLEEEATQKNGTLFLKSKKDQISLAIIDLNFHELFSSWSGANGGF